MFESDQTAHRIVLASRPVGIPNLANFRLEEMPVARPADGQVLLGIRYLSLDPYMRWRMDERPSYSPPVAVGDVMVGEAVAEVLESLHPDYAPGDLVLGYLGWQTHALSDGTNLRKLDDRFIPATTALGVLGMPGFAAYSGLLEIGRPRPGETVVVAAASGPVGSLVGQIARIQGARAVGIAGGAEKCAYVRNILRFDDAIDHHREDLAEKLADACPDGIDVYFENVGGAVWQAVLPLLNLHARVPVCGLVAHYREADGEGAAGLLAATMREILSRRLTLTGFINSDFAGLRPAFLEDVSGWIREGRIRYREDIVTGLEVAPRAFIGMLEGHNFGKLLVEVA